MGNKKKPKQKQRSWLVCEVCGREPPIGQSDESGFLLIRGKFRCTDCAKKVLS